MQYTNYAVSVINLTQYWWKAGPKRAEDTTMQRNGPILFYEN